MGQIVSEAWLKKQGVLVPRDDVRRLLENIQAECEKRVGQALFDAMTAEQVTEFERLCDEGDDDAMSAYLEEAYPDYPKVVRREVRKLREEIRSADDKVGLIGSWYTGTE